MKKRTVFVAVTLFVLGVLAGCASTDQRVNLTYDSAVNAKGGSGELFIAKSEKPQNAAGKSQGEIILGSVKGSDRDIVTKSNVNDWVMHALKGELYAAGYTVKTVPDMPGNVNRGVKIIVEKLAADQTAELVSISTFIDMKISVEIWKSGKKITTISAAAGNEHKGLDRSAGPIELTLKETLQYALRQLVPDIIKTLEQ